MSKLIAVVRLAPGQVAFFDETTGTHLTMGNPMADVYDHMNTFKIKRAVQNKILNLVTGSFNVENTMPEQKIVEIESKVLAPKVEDIKEAVKEVVEIPPVVVVEEILEPAEAIAPIDEVIEEIVETEVTEETTEEIVEETVPEEVVTDEAEVEAKPKTTRKKK